MKFTMARPEESCHPETLLPGARTVVSAALCYYAPEPERPDGPRAPAALHVVRRLRGAPREARRARAPARRLVPRARRREPARRPRGGGAQRRRLLRQEHAADHAAPRLVGRARDARHGRRARADAAARRSTAARAGSASTPARPARSTSRATLDATRCLSYWTQAPAPIPESYRADLGAQVYGCDICQDVCPWNRGIEKRRDGAAAGARRRAARLARRLAAGRPGGAARALRAGSTSRATTAAGCAATRSSRPGNVGGADERAAVEPYLDDDDEMLREHAAWALARLEARGA